MKWEYERRSLNGEERVIWSFDVLVTIREQEIWIQLPQIKWNMSDSMCGINTAQDPQTSTLLRQTLKGEPYPRNRNNSVKDSYFGGQPLFLNPLHSLYEPFHNLLMLTRKLIPINLPGSDMRARLQD